MKFALQLILTCKNPMLDHLIELSRRKNPMLDHLLELSRRDYSNMLSNIGLDEEMYIIEIRIRSLSAALVYASILCFRSAHLLCR